MEVSPDSRPPRWSQTPPAMQAPVRSRRRPEGVQPLKINSDPQKLDQMYIKFFGAGGDTLLGDESKWLAVTHKSFDHGRRGFNDRLSFLGKRILDLQTSLGLLAAHDSVKFREDERNRDPHGRQHFEHPALSSIECLLGGSRNYFTYYKELSRLGSQHGLPEVMRWVPKNPDSLSASGADMVYAQAVLAMIGALALERGGNIANKITKERILTPLGLKRPVEGKKELAL